MLPTFSQVILRTPVTGAGPWNQYLGTDANVMRLDRLIIINDEFRISSRFYADRQLLKRLWDMPMDKLNGANFKKVIIQQFKLPITNITHRVKLADFDTESCERIGVPHPYRGIYMQAVARSGRGQCVYYQEFFLGPTSRDLAFPDANLSSG